MLLVGAMVIRSARDLGQLVGQLVAGRPLEFHALVVHGLAGVAMQASIGGTELLGLLAFGIAALLLATIPALLIYRRPVIEGLR